MPFNDDMDKLLMDTIRGRNSLSEDMTKYLKEYCYEILEWLNRNLVDVIFMTDDVAMRVDDCKLYYQCALYVLRRQ